ncbi:hypothetical protein GOP47_0019779 [Adiantum capillus-veneris]|uniref:Uncharacterized protein n=1 Tax=Adiantum capillus-veneris TaxID=13818 RepID=A0A9D4UD61_ADICA|nr:hypothetical protein GOP47_0019779 [Adiantum capillus-veneris]
MVCQFWEKSFFLALGHTTYLARQFDQNYTTPLHKNYVAMAKTEWHVCVGDDIRDSVTSVERMGLQEENTCNITMPVCHRKL